MKHFRWIVSYNAQDSSELGITPILQSEKLKLKEIT